MTSIADQPQNDTAQAEPPTKKRRGGRRSSNPEISAEERKRLRILKNRESAMRSLAKKAEYSAKLETLEKDAVAEHESSRDSLEKLVATAIALNSALDKVPEDVANLVAKAEKCINRSTNALSEDQDPPSSPAEPAAPSEPASAASAAAAEEADNK